MQVHDIAHSGTELTLFFEPSCSSSMHAHAAAPKPALAADAAKLTLQLDSAEV